MSSGPRAGLAVSSRRRRRADLESIYRAAVAAVEPGRLVARHVRRWGETVTVDLGDRVREVPAHRLWIAGAGKAAVAMAGAIATVVPEARGTVVAPRGRGLPRRLGRIDVLAGAHPVPDRTSFESTARLLARLRRRPRDETVLFLLSGGASALLALPAPPVTPADKRRLGRLLLRCGADIELTNAVRKHVSRVKGGGLLRAAAPREVWTLALSDVIGDRLSTIGSGPTVPDPSTYQDAWDGLASLGALDDLPTTVRRRLAAGVAGRRSAPETVAPGSADARRARACVIGSNRLALRAAAREARRLGYAVRTRRAPLRGEASEAARVLVRSLPAPDGPTCLLAGGETTVTVGAASGVGGRSQELALAAVPELAGRDWSLLAAGTDGIDGPTRAAGGFADGASLRRAGVRAVRRALDDHDAGTLLHRLGDVFVTGPTGTNVMDLVVVLGGECRK